MPIDPCFQELLSDPRNTVRPPPPHVPMDKVRRAADAAMAQGVVPQMVQMEDVAVRAAGREVPFRHYRPVVSRTLPAILFCHGGGFVWGSIDTHDGICRRLAAQTGAAVISVGYRLAPETRFPGPVEDARAVLRHIIEDCEALGLDSAAIALCGDSAGGGICVSLAKIAARDGIPLRHLALIYPALDPDCNTASQRDLADGPLLTQAAMRWFWSCYLGSTDAQLDLLPLGAAYLAGLPPTTIATAEYDPLRDEGAGFAERLTALGVEVESTCFAGMIHGFLSLPATSPVMDGAMRYVAHRLGAALRKPSSQQEV